MSLFKKSKTFLSSSEFVSLGHPDRLADLIAASLIDDIQHRDGWKSHAAVEVFLTHDSVVFGGEITTELNITEEYLKSVVKKAFSRAGYLPEMRKFWSANEVCLADDVAIVNKMQAQSPDIALGTTDKGKFSGYNDQGIAMSSAENTNPTMMGMPHVLAQAISDKLFTLSRQMLLRPEVRKAHTVILGPDNKVVVTLRVKEDGFTPIEVTGVTVAVAHSGSSKSTDVTSLVRALTEEVFKSWNTPVSSDCKWTINGTGRFVVHGNISDTSLTGRKLSVSNPSAGPLWSNKLIGGGALVKPFHASDLMLNVTARLVSNIIVRAGLSSYAVTLVSCSIGSSFPQSVQIVGDKKFMDKYYNKCQKYFTEVFDWSIRSLALKYNIFGKTSFADCVATNFFGNSEVQPWESLSLIDDEVKDLREFL